MNNLLQYNIMINAKTIEIEGTTYSLVKNRVHTPDIAIYSSGTASTYLRIGPAAKIEEERKQHEQLYKAGFPVAEISGSGKLKSKAYYIEKSLGFQTISDLFAEDVKEYGYITESNFSKFVELSTIFAKAQLSVPSKKASFKEFTDGFYLASVQKELPAERELITRTFDKIEQKLAVLPFVPSHGDFNPSNMFEKGVIDLEYFHQAPFGYDLVSALYTTYFFPKDASFEMVRRYEFSKYQRATFIHSMNKLSLENQIPQFTEFTGEFILCRAIFMAALMQDTPKLQAWRFKILHTLMVDYLDGRRIKLPALVETLK